MSSFFINTPGEYHLTGVLIIPHFLQCSGDDISYRAGTPFWQETARVAKKMHVAGCSDDSVMGYSSIYIYIYIYIYRPLTYACKRCRCNYSHATARDYCTRLSQEDLFSRQ